jgi:hypothetical protein
MNKVNYNAQKLRIFSLVGRVEHTTIFTIYPCIGKRKTPFWCTLHTISDFHFITRSINRISPWLEVDSRLSWIELEDRKGFEFWILLSDIRTVKMLSETEFKTIDQVYRVMCKSLVLPFCWKNGKLGLKPRRKISVLYNHVIWLLILVTAYVRLAQIPATAAKNDVNDFLLHGFCILHSLTTMTLRGNVWLHNEEMVQLFNQLLHVNSIWGKWLCQMLLYSTVLSTALE